MEYKNDSESSSKKRIVILCGVIAIIIAIIILLITSCGRSASGRTVFDLTSDANSRVGALPTPDIEKIQQELNKKVEDGMINISMNMNPVFSEGTAPGDLLIVNSEINRYPQIIEIYLRDSNELIYRSGAIAVGCTVETGVLSRDLDAGNYEAVAYFNAVDPDTGLLVGKAGAEILITVES